MFTKTRFQDQFLSIIASYVFTCGQALTLA